MPTNIEWVRNPDGTKGESWNPVTGCTPISEGCAHCWAKRMAQRLRGRFGYPQDDPFAVTLHPDKLDQPLHWRKPRRVFVCSMGDLFHEGVPNGYRTEMFDVMTAARTMQHTFLLLTKRPENINKWENWTGEWWSGDTPWSIAREVCIPGPPNIWFGVTGENQEQLDKRTRVLLEIPAAKHWASIEPMLGPVNTRDYLRGYGRFRTSAALDWVVLGGETGPGARPMHPNWVRDVRDQCIAAGVPFFFKGWGDWFPRDQWAHSPELVLPNNNACQLGNRTYVFPDGLIAHRIGKKRASRLLDGREHNEVPE